MSDTTTSEGSKSSLRDRARKSPKKKKLNQLPIGLLVFVILIVAGFFISGASVNSAIMWGFGLVLGFVLQKTGFCFTAAMRDPSLTGSTSLTKAVIITIAVASVGFFAVQYNSVSSGGYPGGNIAPTGIHTAVGAFLFGIGMVIAGGCASGTLMRVGEGFLQQMIALIFFIIGVIIAIPTMPFWESIMLTDKPADSAIHIPSLIGWPLGILLQFGFLFCLFMIADWYGKKKSA